jgi:NitT/TauT family transport system substrate-binding protein
VALSSLSQLSRAQETARTPTVHISNADRGPGQSRDSPPALNESNRECTASHDTDRKIIIAAQVFRLIRQPYIYDIYGIVSDDIEVSNVEKFVFGVATPQGMTSAYAHFAPAVALGFDRQEGLQLEMFYGGEPGATARALAAGRCLLAGLNTIVGFLGREEGLQMVAVAGIARRTHRTFSVLRDNPIKKLSDLKGKKLSCDFPHLQKLAEAALSEEGIHPTEYEWVPWMGSDMDSRGMIDPLQAGDIDALFVMDWNHGDFTARNVQLHDIPSEMLDRIRVSSCCWAMEPSIPSHKDLMVRGIRALQKSIVYTLENPTSAVEMMWEVFPESRPSGDRAEALAVATEVAMARVAPMQRKSDDPDYRWCALPNAEMREWATMLHRTGVVRDDITADVLYTNDLVGPINEFDTDAVIALARRSIAPSRVNPND